jgi:hypothetical protein
VVCAESASLSETGLTFALKCSLQPVCGITGAVMDRMK